MSRFWLNYRRRKRGRLLGAVVERDTPGFQVDGLGVGSLNCLCVLRESEALDHEIFAHRPYDLVIFHIGSNTWNPAVMDPVACMKESIARLRRSKRCRAWSPRSAARRR